MGEREMHIKNVTAIAGVLVAGATGAVQAQDATFRATLEALNTGSGAGEPTGEVVLTRAGDQLTIRVEVQGAPPSMAHLQHFHGFATGEEEATCPDQAADANGDGVIDLIETEAVAGTTMVPFHDDPVSMEIVNDTYPEADAEGDYAYEATVSVAALEAAFATAYPGQELDLERRVVFVHGVAEDTELPSTVASLGDIPAQVTLPIACGELEPGN
jgi:hypothetical protein